MQRVGNGVLDMYCGWWRLRTAVRRCGRSPCLVSAHAHASGWAGAVLLLICKARLRARLRHVHLRRVGLQAWHWVDLAVANGIEPLVEAAKDGSPVVHRFGTADMGSVV